MGTVRRAAHGLIVLLLLCVAAGAAAAQDAPARKVALVIGNGAYEAVAALPNPVNDAAAVAASFGRLGFEVTLVEDADQTAMRRAIQDFELAVAGADIAAVFYAGHGLEMGGENYLIPVDAELARDTHVDDEAIPLERLLRAVERVRTLGLIIIDACRNNPFAGEMEITSPNRSVGRGLARVEPDGLKTMVVFAAREGTIADDGDDGHSPFTTALLANIEKPGVEVGFLFRIVTADVVQATGGAQEPVSYTRLGPVPIFLLPPVVVQQNVEVGANVLAAYQAAVAIDTIEAWDTFLTYFGDSGYYADLARAARNKLVAPNTVVPINVPPPVSVIPDVPQFVNVLPVERPPVSEAMALCDQLTAYARDLDRPASVPPVSFETALDNIDDAVAACRTAVDEQPQDRRYLFQLGRALSISGEGAAAIEIHRQAAALGSAAAMNELGYEYKYGDFVPQDIAMALSWFEQAAAAGSTDAMINLGSIYDAGDVVDEDVAAAVRWYRMAADLGDPAGMESVGYLYETGRGVPQSYAEARVWYGRAADGGNASAMNSLGFLLDRGLGGPIDLERAIELYRQAADGGNAYGMNNLGFRYETGEGVAPDLAAARTLYQRAAAAGNSYGMYNLGRLYQDGIGVTRNYVESAQWYQRAADLGHVYAMSRLGLMYDNGWGVLQDVAAARGWWEAAAEGGVGDAMHNLGYLYEIGRGVARDVARAAQYYVAALEVHNGATIDEFIDHAMSYDIVVRRAVEQFLADQGLPAGPVDGKMDKATMAALELWR